MVKELNSKIVEMDEGKRRNLRLKTSPPKNNERRSFKENYSCRA